MTHDTLVVLMKVMKTYACAVMTTDNYAVICINDTHTIITDDTKVPRQRIFSAISLSSQIFSSTAKTSYQQLKRKAN